MYKVSQMLQPNSIQQLFVPYEHIHGRETRRAISNTWYPPRAKLQMTTKGFRHRGYHVWEELPNELKVKSSFNAFKKAWSQI